jgi:L-histidine N-alpha-methyltransferase
MQHHRRHERAEPEVDRVRFIDLPPSHLGESFAHAVLRGLTHQEKEIPSRFLYDTEGSRLFEQITRLPEYYLTRCETEILKRHAGEVIAAAGQPLQTIEFGSGSSEKTRLLLNAAIERQGPLEYVPIDISSDFLRASAGELIEDVPGVRVTALGGDYLDALRALPPHDGCRLFLFLGSTIGNFEPSEAVSFLAAVRSGMGQGDRLLVGQDVKKPGSIIEPAYNDSNHVTERFNKNVLARINRELCGRFDLASFEHSAPWIEETSRIEMRLISRVDQEVAVEGLDRSFHFRAGEFIHTENSHKWSPEAFAAMCDQAGLEINRTFHDAKHWFALHLLQVH